MIQFRLKVRNYGRSISRLEWALALLFGSGAALTAFSLADKTPEKLLGVLLPGASLADIAGLGGHDMDGFLLLICGTVVFCIGMTLGGLITDKGGATECPRTLVANWLPGLYGGGFQAKIRCQFHGFRFKSAQVKFSGAQIGQCADLVELIRSGLPQCRQIRLGQLFQHWCQLFR